MSSVKQLHFSEAKNHEAEIKAACEQFAAEAKGLWDAYLEFEGPHRTRTVTRALGQFHGLKAACVAFGRPDMIKMIDAKKLDFLASFETSDGQKPGVKKAAKTKEGKSCNFN